mgnify:CR=1 FL=1
MNTKELGEYCNNINIDCNICNHTKECEKFRNLLEEVSPCGFLNLANNMEKQKVD